MIGTCSSSCASAETSLPGCSGRCVPGWGAGVSPGTWSGAGSAAATCDGGAPGGAWGEGAWGAGFGAAPGEGRSFDMGILLVDLPGSGGAEDDDPPGGLGGDE